MVDEEDFIVTGGGGGGRVDVDMLFKEDLLPLLMFFFIWFPFFWNFYLQGTFTDQHNLPFPMC